MCRRLDAGEGAGGWGGPGADTYLPIAEKNHKSVGHFSFWRHPSLSVSLLEIYRASWRIKGNEIRSELKI